MTTKELLTLVADIFRKAGLSTQHAEAMSRTFVHAERDGCKSHGVYRIEVILKTIKAGKVDPQAKPEVIAGDAGIIRVNANKGFSSLPFEMAASMLAERAQKLGLAALVINDVVHVSALWPEIEILADRGVASIAMCPSYAVVAPAGGTKPLFGTNPFAFGWPRKGRPHYVFDFATSVAARGEVELHRISGKPLPEGWAVDSDGKPTTDPTQALAGAMLPFGAHKGSAISTMIELMAGAMIGDLVSKTALEELGTTALIPRHGELVLAFSPEHFSEGRAQDPFATAEIVLEGIADQGARMPSSRRYAARAKSEVEGITLSDAEMQKLERFLKLGLDAVS